MKDGGMKETKVHFYAEKRGNSKDQQLRMHTGGRVPGYRPKNTGGMIPPFQVKRKAGTNYNKQTAQLQY